MSLEVPLVADGSDDENSILSTTQRDVHLRSRQKSRHARLMDLGSHSPRRRRSVLQPTSRLFQNIGNDPRITQPLLPTPVSQESLIRNDNQVHSQRNENIVFPLTPAATANDTRNSNEPSSWPLPPTRAQIAQRQRRERERQARSAHIIPSNDEENMHIFESRRTGEESCIMNDNSSSRMLPRARQQYSDPDHRHNLGSMTVVCRYCDALHWDAKKTKDSRRDVPNFGLCCNHGKISLPVPNDPPPVLRALLIDSTAEAREFRLHIRQYNSALAFTSIGFQPDRSITERPGIYVFRIHGQLYHQSGTLLPSEGQSPRYAQLYIHDPSFALEQRMSRNPDLSRETMETLQNMLSHNHFYAGFYKHTAEIFAENENVQDISIAIRADRSRDMRRYNLPTADEVALIIPGDGSDDVQKRDIILRRRDGPLQRVSEGHPAYEPLHYVLMIPGGEDGWSWDMRLLQPDSNDPNRLTHTAYHAYVIHQRIRQFPTKLLCGRLFQQYVVDMWARAEQNNLNWVRNNQEKIRVDLYSGLEDALSADDHADLGQLGHRIILPSSFVGGPRYMNQLYQDSMAAARFYKKIDLFVTVTANPKWREISEALLPNQTTADRPDLVARVFLMKKKAIIDDICNKHIFGPVVSYVYTIEFQKRGLPHMHLLLFLERGSKLLQPCDIDTVISAKWPNPETEPKLFETVKHCLVHGPCGTVNPSAPCMEDGNCTKYYPKDFQSATLLDDSGYPLYKRPDNGVSHQVRDCEIDNRWIVPYNPYLTAKYDCHINVECAASFASLKYVHKYIYKGHDRATLEIDRENEPKRYEDARYISPPEAAWRIFHFELHKQVPNVVRLEIHLPEDHSVTYHSDDEAEEVLDRARDRKSTLTAFFAACGDNSPIADVARQYTYQEFPQHFVWQKTHRRWKIRQKGFALGRMYYIDPTAGELFYLRTLLTVVRGPKSFLDLRTVHGITHNSYHGACLALGLLQDDGEWRMCLEEATEMQTGSRSRQLFCTILMFCEPSQPDQLWNEFRAQICDDLNYRLQRLGRIEPSEEDIYDYGLHLLNNLLRDYGHSLNDFPSMPTPQQEWTGLTTNRFIADQLDFDINLETAQLREHITHLNADQRSAFDQIFESIEQMQGRLFFLNGPAGTGKTYLYKTLCHAIRSREWIVLCVASSGIAALLLPGGRTSHSMFKIPIDNLNDHSSCSIRAESQLADLIRNVKAIIWDEVTMQHRNGAEAVSRTCQDIRRNANPFGGITVIFGGDFQQILPVIVKGSREQIVAASLQRSLIWQDITILSLIQNMRLDQDSISVQFGQWLLDIGHGRTMNADGIVKFPPNLMVNNIEHLIQFVFPGISSQPPPPAEYFAHRVILSPRNDDVEDLNLSILQLLHGEEITFMSSDSVIHEPGADTDLPPQPPEFLRALNASGLPPGELHLKIGCPLILLRNLAPRNGLCNGTRMILLRATTRVLEVQIMGGEHNGEIAFIPRISLTPSIYQTGFNFLLRRRQFPVRLAFAMTINKSQGQSVKYVGLDLRIPVFTHGQLYVALSRATSGQRIKILIPPNTDQAETINVVYPEVLLD